MATYYWVGGGGDYTDSTNHWSTSSGGAPSVSNVPTLSDNVVFDVNSSGASYTVNINVADSPCNNITCTAPSTGNLTISGLRLRVFGNITLYNGIVWNAATNINGANCQIQSNGGTHNSSVTFTSGITSLLDNYIGSNWTANGSGGIITNGYNVTLSNFFQCSGGSTRTINISNSTFQILFWSSVTTTNVTFIDTGATIILRPNGITTQVLGTLTFSKIILDRAIAGASNTTFRGNFSVLDFGVINHTVAWTMLIFGTGSSATFGKFNVSGAPGALITISATSSVTFNFIKAGDGVISCDYLNLNYCIASPGLTWYAGANSVNNLPGTGGSGWIFTVPPQRTNKFYLF